VLLRQRLNLAFDGLEAGLVVVLTVEENARGAGKLRNVTGNVATSPHTWLRAGSRAVCDTLSFGASRLISAALHAKLEESADVKGAICVFLVLGNRLGFLVSTVYSRGDLICSLAPIALVAKGDIVVIASVFARGGGPHSNMIKFATSASGFVGLGLRKSAQSSALRFAEVISLLVGLEFHGAVGSSTAHGLGVAVFSAPVRVVPAELLASLLGSFSKVAVDTPVGRFSYVVTAKATESVLFLCSSTGEVPVGPEVGDGEVTLFRIVNRNVIHSAGTTVDLRLLSVHGPRPAGLEVAASLLALLPILGGRLVDGLDTREEVHGVHNTIWKASFFFSGYFVFSVLVVHPLLVGMIDRTILAHILVVADAPTVLLTLCHNMSVLAHT